MKTNEMTIEQISTQLLAGILANPKVFNAFDNDYANIKRYSARVALEYAQELKDQAKDFNVEDVEDAEYEILK